MDIRNGLSPAIAVLVAVLACVGLTGCGEPAGRGSTQSPSSPSPAATMSTRQVVDYGKTSTIQLVGDSSDNPSVGTGVLVDAAEGYVVTSAGVVAGVATLQGRLAGSHDTTPAKILGVAPCEDLAVVQLDTVPSGARAATMGVSGSVHNADPVTALGFPVNAGTDFTSQDVVSTSGSVQAPRLSNVDVGPRNPQYPEVIQHSAALTSASAGGPLFNDRAELIGVNVFGSDRSSSPNEYYSIAIDRVKRLLPGLEAGKSIDDVGWDLVPVDYFDYSVLDQPQAQQAVDAVNKGKIVGLLAWNVRPGSPAAETKAEGQPAPILAGDSIYALKETRVRTFGDVCNVLKSATPGETLKVRGQYFLTDITANTPVGTKWTVELTLPK